MPSLMPSFTPSPMPRRRLAPVAVMAVLAGVTALAAGCAPQGSSSGTATASAGSASASTASTSGAASSAGAAGSSASAASCSTASLKTLTPNTLTVGTDKPAYDRGSKATTRATARDTSRPSLMPSPSGSATPSRTSDGPSLPDLIKGLWLNIRVWAASAVGMLVLGTILAVLRSLKGPVRWPPATWTCSAECQ